MKDNNAPAVVSAASAMFLATGITLEAVQIIYYILAGLAILFSLSFTVWKWYKAAKADGKITAEEIEDLEKQVKETINKEIKK